MSEVLRKLGTLTAVGILPGCGDGQASQHRSLGVVCRPQALLKVSAAVKQTP